MIPATTSTTTGTINNPVAGGVGNDKYPHPSLMNASGSSSSGGSGSGSSGGGINHSMKAEERGVGVATATLGGAKNSVSEYQQYAHYNQFHGTGTRR